MGCGGSLILARRERARVHAAVLSPCKEETPRIPSLRTDEFRRACGIIGAEPHVFDITNRRLPEHRSKIMAILERLQEDVKPDLVFVPSLEDPHQDHETVAKAAIRTFRRNETILQYEILRYGSQTFTPSLFVDITDVLERKIAALMCHDSQLQSRAYFDEESFRSLARTRGAQSGCQYAEAFVLYKMFW